MLEHLGSAARFLKNSKIDNDSFACKTVYKLQVFFLLAAAVVTLANNNLSVKVECRTSAAEDAHHISSYCYDHGTTIYFETESEAEKGKKDGYRVAPGVYLHPDPDREVFLNRTKFFPYIYLVMALTSYIGRMVWRCAQRKVLVSVVRNLADDSLKTEAVEEAVATSSKRFFANMYRHSSYAGTYFFVVVINVVVEMLNGFVVLVYVARSNLKFGWQSFQYTEYNYQDYPFELAVAFPQTTVCKYPLFGIGAGRLYISGLCQIHSSTINQVLMACYWWSIVVITPILVFELFQLCLQVTFPKLRLNELRNLLNVTHHSDVDKVLKKLNFGSYFVVKLLAKNMDPSILCQILEDVKCEMDSNEFSKVYGLKNSY